MTEERGRVVGTRGRGAAAAEAEDVAAAGRDGAAAGAATAAVMDAALAGAAATAGAATPVEAVRSTLEEEGCAGARANCTTVATPVDAAAERERCGPRMRCVLPPPPHSPALGALLCDSR